MYFFVLLNVLVRGVFVDFEIGSDHSDLDEIFYLGKSKAFMTWSNVVLLVGFVFLTLGYLWARTRSHSLNYRIFKFHEFDAPRLRRAVILMLLTSGIAFIVFVRFTFTDVADFAIDMISQHRGVSDDLSEYRAYGYLRLLIGLSNIVVYLSYVVLRSRTSARGFYRFALALGFLIALAMAFYSQARASLVFLFLNLVFIKYYLDRRRLPWRGLAIATPAVIVLFVVTSSFRAGSGVDFRNGITAMTAVAPIVLNNGGIDASKTGHIIDYTTETDDFRFGETLFQFVWAAVPRQIWPEKPVNLDTYVGEKIYDADAFGSGAVPPGFFAEMFMNFWYTGIAFGGLALGLLLRFVNNLLMSNGRNPGFILFYVVVLQSVGMSALSSGVSSTILGDLMAGIPLVIVLNYVVARPVPTETASATLQGSYCSFI